MLHDVNYAIFLYPYRFELTATLNSVFAHFFQCARKCYLFDIADEKALFSEVFYAVRDLNMFEIKATLKRSVPDPL